MYYVVPTCKFIFSEDVKCNLQVAYLYIVKLCINVSTMIKYLGLSVYLAYINPSALHSSGLTSKLSVNMKLVHLPTSYLFICLNPF